MASRSRVVWLLIVGSLVALASPALAGFIMTDDKDNRTVISRGRLKVSSKEQHVILTLDIGRGRLWLANPQSRRVWEGTVDEYCEGLRRIVAAAMTAAQAQMAERKKEMERQLQQLPQAQREQMEQMLKRMNPQAQGTTPPRPRREVLVQASGELLTVAGLQTRKYQVLAGGRPYEDVWLTPDLSLANELDVERTAETFGKMSGCAAGVAKGSEDIVETTPEYSRLYRLGWPLKIVLYEDPQGKPTEGQTRMLITKLERGEIPEAEFAVPADYQRAPLDEVIGGAQ